jgi:hypothetical protein
MIMVGGPVAGVGLEATQDAHRRRRPMIPATGELAAIIETNAWAIEFAQAFTRIQ